MHLVSSNQQPASSSEQFPALTGIRAVAVCMVFLQHLPLWLGHGFFIGLQLSFHFCVCLFFVLSGFLISYRYYDELELSGKWFRRYFVNRFARIYPVYFLVLTVVVITSRATDPVFLLQNYTFFHNFDPFIHSRGMAIQPSWSLTVEECFYVAAPFIMWLTAKYKLLVPFLLFLLLLAFSLPFIGSLSITKQFVFLFSTIFGRFPEFFSGILLMLIVKRKQREGIVSFNGVKFTTLGISIMFMLMLPLIYVTNKPPQLQYPVMLLVDNLLMPVGICFLYFGFVFEQSLVRRALASKPMGLLGRSSYALFLLHMPVITYFGASYLEHGLFLGHHNMYVIFTFIFCLVLAILIYVFYEEPLRRFITKRFAYSTVKGTSGNLNPSR